MTTDVSPRTIDALVPIEQIWVIGRHRKDLGDIDSLAASIADVDLLNPVTITPDYRLIAGERRVEACRRLGWDTIPARVVSSLTEAAALLRAERDENTQRKPMLLSELASLGEALHALESENARERKAAAGRSAAPGRPAERCDELVTSFSGGDKNRTREVVGQALGMSGSSYNSLRFVYKAANDDEVAPSVRKVAREALAEMDRTGKINPSEARVRAAMRANQEALAAKASALASAVMPDELDPLPPRRAERLTPPGGEWVPEVRDNTSAAVTQRRTLIAQLGGQGWTSDQIGERLNLVPGTVRRIAREESISIQADVALGVRTNKKIDSNRVVRETIHTLESLEMGINLISFDALDPSEIQGWTDSLSEAIRVLNRLNRRLKEKAQ